MYDTTLSALGLTTSEYPLLSLLLNVTPILLTLSLTLLATLLCTSLCCALPSSLASVSFRSLCSTFSASHLRFSLLHTLHCTGLCYALPSPLPPHPHFFQSLLLLLRMRGCIHVTSGVVWLVARRREGRRSKVFFVRQILLRSTRTAWLAEKTPYSNFPSCECMLSES